MIRRFFATAVVVNLSGFAGPVCAQHERVVVTYDAPPDCPSATAFVDSVIARLPAGHTVALAASPPDVPQALTLSVRITKSSSSYRAELTSFTAEGWSSPRHLEDPTCEELTDAMAFTAALTVDPNASADVPPPSQPPPQPAEPAPPPTKVAAPPARRAEPELSTGDADSRSAPHLAEWRTSILAGALVSAAMAPGISPGVSAGIRYSDEALGSWSPAFTLSAFAAKSVVLTRSLDASFDFVGGQLDFCPSSTGTGHVKLRPCLHGQLSLLSAKASNLTNTTDISVAVPSVGATLELQVRLSSSLFLSTTAGGQVVLQRHRFDVGRPAEELAETRGVSPYFGLRIGADLGGVNQP